MFVYGVWRTGNRETHVGTSELAPFLVRNRAVDERIRLDKAVVDGDQRF